MDATTITNEYWKSYEVMLQDLQTEPEAPNSAPEKDPKAIEVEAASRRNLEQRVQNSLPARGCWKKIPVLNLLSEECKYQEMLLVSLS